MDIYIADFIFYRTSKNKELPVLVEKVVCKYMPLKFLINDGMAYKRAIRGFSDTFYKELVKDTSTGLKKFKINYIKKIGETNQ